MARNKLPILAVTSFAGGLNTAVSATKVKESESPSLQNVEFTENGLPSKRRGTDLYGDAPDSDVLGLGSLYMADGTRYHVRASGTSLYYLSGDTWTAITGLALTAGKNMNFVQARGALYGFNGTDKMAKWTGSGGATQPAYGVTASFGIYYKNRLIASGNATAPTRVYMSSSKNADTFTGLSGTATAGGATTLTDTGKSWTTNEFEGLKLYVTAGTGAGQYRTVASNTATVLTVTESWTTNPDNTSQYTVEGGDTIDIAKDDGQAVTGLAKFENKLLIFKERSVYSMTFDDVGPIVELVSASYGCVSHRSIDSVENDVFFLAQDGVRTIGYVPNIVGQLRTNLLTLPVKGEIDNINPAYYGNCCAIYHDNLYILAYPRGSSAVNDRMLAFSTVYGCWTAWTGMGANCFNQFIDTDGREKLYYGDERSGQACRMLSDNYTDGATEAIDAYWYSKQFDMGNPALKKGAVFIDFQVRALNGTLGLDVILDGAVTQLSTAIASTFTGDDGLRSFMMREAMLREDAGSTAATVAADDVRRVYLSGDFRTIQVKAYNAAAGENFTLMGLWIGWQPRSPFDFDSSKQLY